METTIREILQFIIGIKMVIGYFIGLGLGYLWAKNKYKNNTNY